MTLTIDDAFETETAALTDVERGRLLLCMQRYAAKGEEMELSGNERFLWPVYRMRIDQARHISAAREEAGRRSGESRRKNEQTGTSENKPEQNGTNLNKPEQTGTKTNAVQAAPDEEKEKGTQKEKERECEGTVPPLSVPRSARKQEAAALFDRFWAEYPRKDDKKNAQRAFLRIKPDEETLQGMLAALRRQKNSRQWMDAGGRYIPLPATWINGERWNDQMQEGPPGRTVSAQQYAQRDYTEEELDSVSDDLLEEARRERANGGGSG